MRTLLLTLFLGLGLSVGASARAQSLWVETGLGYLETAPQVYASGAKFGLRATLPLTEEPFGPEAFAALALRGGIILDAGVWVAFAPGGTDPFGLQTYAGAGLSLVGGEFGLALALALSYEIERDLALTLAYTHRPILTPRLAQAFDLSLGLKLSLRD